MLAVALVVVAAIAAAITWFDGFETLGGPVPAPATIALLLVGFSLFSLARRRA